MKLKYFISQSALCCLLLSACADDILNKQPLDIISDAAVYTDQTLADAVLTQAYTMMSVLINETPVINNPADGVWYPHSDAWNGPFIVNELADEAVSNWIGGQSGNAKRSGITNSGGILEWWENAYVVNRILNEYMAGLEGAALPEDYRVKRKAEARFLRAFNYFYMVKRYGGIPLVTTAQSLTDPEEEIYKARSSEKEVYDFIISEMDDIMPDLADREGTELGRPSRGTALALKSRAALYAGSIAQFGTVAPNGLTGISESPAVYYQKAYDAAKQLMTEGEYALYNADADKVVNYKNVFLKDNNIEVIFMHQHDGVLRTTSGGNGWIWDFFQCPKPHAWGAGNQNAPYLEMAEEFEYADGTSGKLDWNDLESKLWSIDELWGGRDPRFYATIWTQGTPWQGGTVDFHNGLILPDGQTIREGAYQEVEATGTQGPQFGTGFGVMKYLDETHDNTGDAANSSIDFILFRYGEILLNFAEAAFELGKIGEAIDAINQLRSRAGVAPLASLTRAQIRHERKVELAFEGHRYWDLRRWRIALNELTTYRSGLRYILDYQTRKYKLQVLRNYEGTTPVFQEQNYYFPITPTRIANNNRLIENPGY